jgi:hypothetical protein
MIAETTTKHSTTSTSDSSDGDRVVRPDSECRATASEFLTELIGSPPDDLLWDGTHHLRGHGHFHGRELIVIAPRDDDHQTVVLTAEDWDAVRRASTDQRHDLLNACALVDHNRLLAVLSDQRLDSSSLTIAA